MIKNNLDGREGDRNAGDKEGGAVADCRHHPHQEPREVVSLYSNYNPTPTKLRRVFEMVQWGVGRRRSPLGHEKIARTKHQRITD